jgi:cytochrome c-type biogenesis protein CcmF
MFVVLWGTLFPVLSEAVRGVKISVAAPFFNQVNVPLGLALLFLSGVCPLIAWRKASARNLRRQFLSPLMLAFLATAVLYTAGIRHIMALIALAICLFASGTIVLEFSRGTRAHRLASGASVVQAFLTLIRRNRRRYGGYIIHFWGGLIFLGIMSASYPWNRTWSAPGASASSGHVYAPVCPAGSVLQPTYEGAIATIRFRVMVDGSRRCIGKRSILHRINSRRRWRCARLFDDLISSWSFEPRGGHL